MNIDIKDVITLSDSNEYAVCSKTSYQGKEYIYLVDINNNENLKFGLVNQNEKSVNVTELKNPQLIQILLPLFYENAKHILEELPNADN